MFLFDAALNVGDTVQRAFPVTRCEPACLNIGWTDRGVNPAWIPVCKTRCSFLSYRLHPPVYLEPVCAHRASLKPNSVRGLRQAAAGRRVEAAPCDHKTLPAPARLRAHKAEVSRRVGAVLISHGSSLKVREWWNRREERHELTVCSPEQQQNKTLLADGAQLVSSGFIKT